MGLIRDLNSFYDVEINDNVYEKKLLIYSLNSKIIFWIFVQKFLF